MGDPLLVKVGAEVREKGVVEASSSEDEEVEKSSEALAKEGLEGRKGPGPPNMKIRKMRQPNHPTCHL
jgi:hypothetical protein